MNKLPRDKKFLIVVIFHLQNHPALAPSLHEKMTPAAYTLADQLYSVAPWENFMEYHLIALIDPATGERHHISLMGASGNHMALALYLGASARQLFNCMQELELPDDDQLGLILTTPQLQCAFSERGDLMKSELAAIKASGKKYRGESWPSFRRFVPGHGPAPASPAEVTLLCHAIEQTLIVAQELCDPHDTIRSADRGSAILTRVLRDGEWRTEWTENDNSLFDFPHPAPSELLIEKILRHPKSKPLDFSYQIIPAPVGKSRENCLFPYVLLLVEPVSAIILGFEMLSVEKHPHEELPALAVNALLRLLDRNGICPTALNVSSPVTGILLYNTAAALGIPCNVKERLPALERARQSMLSSMMR